jgi:hypothetical protein
MKRLFLLSIAMFFLGGILNAQDTNFVSLDPFTSIEIGDDFIVTLVQSDSKHGISRNPNIRIENDNGELEISGTSEYKSRRNRKGGEPLIIYCNTLESLDLSDAVNVKMPENSQFVGQNLEIEMSNVSNAGLNLDYKSLDIEMSGASKLILSGTAQKLDVECSGTANINTSKLENETADIETSGASIAIINSKTVSGSVSAASRSYFNPDAQISVSKSGVASINRINIDTNGVAQPASSESGYDWDEFAKEMEKFATEMANFAVELTKEVSKSISEGMNEAQIEISREKAERDIERANQQAEKARQQAEVAREQAEKARQQTEKQTKKKDEKDKVGNLVGFTYDKKKKPSFVFDPAYPGIDFGFNGYEGGKSLPSGYEDMELSQNTSFVFNLNLFDYGFKFAQRGRSTFGLGVGLGIGWNIYKFYDKSIDPMLQNGQFQALPYAGLEQRENFQKSKLQISSLKIPVFLTFQQKKGFHVSAGIVGNVRIGSSSKQVYSLASGLKGRSRNKSNFGLSPFRADAEVRLGYKHFSFFVTHALTDMFLSNHGPELSQYSFGVSLGL